LVKLFHEPQHLSGKSDEEPDVGFTEIDYEEQTAGYQAAFSRLAASESAQTDCVAYAGQPRVFLGQQLATMTKVHPETKRLVLAEEGSVVRPFLHSIGYEV